MELPSDANNVVDVCIIGAGIAGLKSAQLLLQDGISNITILEARNRVGGRVHCVPLTNTEDFVDLGAHYIHGSEDNPLYDDADKHGDVVTTEDDNMVMFYTPDGTALDTEATDEIITLFDTAMEEVVNDKEFCTTGNKTLQDILIRAKQKVKQQHRKFASKITSENIDVVLDYIGGIHPLDSGCDKGTQLTAASFHEYVDCEGELYIYMRNGFSNILNRLAASIKPTAIVKLNSLVTKIDYSRDSNCQVSVKDANKSYTLFAKHVLCTLPLGCLKAGTVEFVPSLPDSKQTAITSLGWGLIDRLIFFCDRHWWPQDAFTYSLLIAWPESSRAAFKPSCQNSSLYKNEEDMKWYQNMLAFEVEPGIATPVITVVVAGHWAKVVEDLPDREILGVVGELVTKILAPHFGYEPRAPVGLIRSRWGVDPYSRGSYSHVPPGGTTEMFDTLAEPLPSKDKPRLLFAGEATHSTQFSSAHGAWKSAVRETNRLRALKGSSK